MQYEIVEAKTADEAIAKAKVKAGDLVRVSRVVASTAGEGKYSLIHEIEPEPIKLPETIET